jgi:hypothetical protein
MTETDDAVPKLIERYLDIVANDDYERFGELLTHDCTFTLMPIGRTWRGREDVMSAVMAAGSSRTHDCQSKVNITNWFTNNNIWSSNTSTPNSWAEFISGSTDIAGYFTFGRGVSIRCGNTSIPAAQP